MRRADPGPQFGGHATMTSPPPAICTRKDCPATMPSGTMTFIALDVCGAGGVGAGVGCCGAAAGTLMRTVAPGPQCRGHVTIISWAPATT